MRLCKNLYEPAKEGFAIYKLLTKAEDKFVCFRKYSTGNKISRVFYSVEECTKWLDACPLDYPDYLKQLNPDLIE